MVNSLRRVCRWKTACVSGLVSVWVGSQAQMTRAMEFTPIAGPNGYIIAGSGEILLGDRVRLVTAIDSLPIGQTLFGLVLNSPGGNVFEAARLADTVRQNGLTVGVVQGETCASACFLPFAASPHKMVSLHARVGVHSASIDATETLGAMAMTTAMARQASALGVPSSIVGRMVTTEPGRMAWLSPDELRSMNVTFFEEAESRKVPPGPARDMAGTPSASATAQPGLAFQQGFADRKSWEAWFTILAPDVQAGAEFWTSQRSLKNPAPCVPPPTASSPDKWSYGCSEAKTRITPFEQRRRAEPEYRAGWNSF